MPISAYGSTGSEASRFRSQTMPEALEREERLDVADRAGMRRDEVDEAAGPDHRRLDAELAADRVDDAVHLAGESVDEP